MHVSLYLEDETPQLKDIINNAKYALYDLVAQLGGTLTGEHGVGLKRAHDVARFLDSTQIDLIKRVKIAFDPDNILNPGKIVPW